MISRDWPPRERIWLTLPWLAGRLVPAGLFLLVALGVVVAAGVLIGAVWMLGWAR